MLKLARIYELLPVKQQKAVVELVTLAYNLTSSGFRTIPLITKIQAVTGLNINEIEIPSLSVYPSSDTPPPKDPWTLRQEGYKFIMDSWVFSW